MWHKNNKIFKIQCHYNRPTATVTVEEFSYSFFLRVLQFLTPNTFTLSHLYNIHRLTGCKLRLLHATASILQLAYLCMRLLLLFIFLLLLLLLLFTHCWFLWSLEYFVVHKSLLPVIFTVAA